MFVYVYSIKRCLHEKIMQVKEMKSKEKVKPPPGLVERRVAGSSAQVAPW
jgi:hypothetical protein